MTNTIEMTQAKFNVGNKVIATTPDGREVTGVISRINRHAHMGFPDKFHVKTTHVTHVVTEGNISLFN